LVCPGGYADLSQGCLWEYRMLLSLPCPRLPKPSGRRRLAAWGLAKKNQQSKETVHKLEENLWLGSSGSLL
jgi:hypothetical protein